MRHYCQICVCALIGALIACGPEPVGEGPPPGIDSIQHALSTIDCTKSSDTGYTNGNPFPIVVVHVDGEPVQIETANAYYVMAKDAAAAGVNIKVVSGFRTYAEQQWLYNCYINKVNCEACNNCNLAAPPGHSEHNSGHALDLNTAAGGVLNWLNNNGGHYGFKRTVPSESWHWEWWGGGPGGGPCDGGDEAYYDISCLEDAGTCQSREKYACASGDWRTGLCPGGADVQCCTFYGSSCAEGAGTCQSRASYTCASGDWRTGLCPGGADVQCCVGQPEVPDAPKFPLLSIAATAIAEPEQDADPCKLGTSAGIHDLFVDESAVVVVDLRNAGTAAAANTKVAIAASAPYLEVRSWRILGKTGDAFEVDDSDAQQQIPRAAPGGTFELNLGTIAPDASKRVELTVIATAPSLDALGSRTSSRFDVSADAGQSGDQSMSDGSISDGATVLASVAADAAASTEPLGHPDVRAWVAHVDDFYEKPGYAAAPDNVGGYQQQDGGDLKASFEIDVLGPEIRNHADDDCDGEVDEQIGQASGGCAAAPSSARPALPWLLALVGLLVARRRRAARLG